MPSVVMPCFLSNLSPSFLLSHLVAVCGGRGFSALGYREEKLAYFSLIFFILFTFFK